MKGRKPKAPQGLPPVVHTRTGEWAVLHNGKIVQIEAEGLLNCTIRVYVKEDLMIVPYRITNIPPPSIKHTIPEEVAKAMLLLQGIEL
jgi:hypothetical protein